MTIRRSVSRTSVCLPHRCWRCDLRRTLSKRLDDYVRTPKCKRCGTRSLYLCKDRLAKNWGRKHKCNCGGYWFPHRKGSKWCEHHPRANELLFAERRRAA